MCIVPEVEGLRTGIYGENIPSITYKPGRIPIFPTLHRFVQLWACKSYEELVRKEALDSGVWPPPTDAVALQKESKMLTPFGY